MAYTKCDCVDGQTVISAELMNRMQDALCAATQHAESKGNPHGMTAEDFGAIPKENEGEAVLVAGAGREIMYRLAVTTAGNLRIDASADGGTTWERAFYAPKTSNAGSAASPVIAAAGRAGSVAAYNNGAADGAGLWLYGNDHANAGKFRLQVYDEENNKYRQLNGSPDGSLQWDGKELGKTEAVSLTMATQSNYTINAIEAYYRAGVVDIHIDLVIATAANSWVTIATLPSGYRPPANTYEDVPYYRLANNYEHLRFRVLKTGEIQIGYGHTGATYKFHDTFVTA